MAVSAKDLMFATFNPGEDTVTLLDGRVFMACPAGRFAKWQAVGLIARNVVWVLSPKRDWVLIEPDKPLFAGSAIEANMAEYIRAVVTTRKQPSGWAPDLPPQQVETLVNLCMDVLGESTNTTEAAMGIRRALNRGLAMAREGRT